MSNMQNEKPTPWYRSSSYKGNLTEGEKNELDALRASPSHPAAQYAELPEEVQMYISGLELEVHDLKKDKWLWMSAVMLVALISLSIPIWAKILLAIAVIVICIRENKKIKHDNQVADEKILQEWELIYIANRQLNQHRE